MRRSQEPRATRQSCCSVRARRAFAAWEAGDTPLEHGTRGPRVPTRHSRDILSSYSFSSLSFFFCPFLSFPSKV